jgi:hypothetical protein
MRSCCSRTGRDQRDTMVTKADHLDLSRKIDNVIKDYGERIEDLEKRGRYSTPP